MGFFFVSVKALGKNGEMTLKKLVTLQRTKGFDVLLMDLDLPVHSVFLLGKLHREVSLA